MLILVAEGKTNREIAVNPHLGEGTVRNYVNATSSADSACRTAPRPRRSRQAPPRRSLTTSSSRRLPMKPAELGAYLNGPGSSRSSAELHDLGTSGIGKSSIGGANGARIGCP